MEKIKNCGVYCYQNMINEKRYIGQSVNLKQRKRCFGKKFRYSGSYFQNAVNKYGAENFQYSVLVYCEPEELNHYEQFYIEKYKTNDRRYGYNRTTGGDSQFFRDEEWKESIRATWTEERRKKKSEMYKGNKNPNYGKRWKSKQKKHAQIVCKKRSNRKFFQINGFDISELGDKVSEYVAFNKEATKSDVKKHFHISDSRLKDICKEFGINIITEVYGNNFANKKPVVQCDIDNHDIILNIFPSLKEAMKITGMQSLKHCVYGKQSHGCGYYWRFANENEKPFEKLNEKYLKPTSLYNKISPEAMEKLRNIGKRKKPNLYKKVYCYNDEGILCKTYESAGEAEIDGFHKRSVCGCCTGKQRTYKNYVFSYKELTVDEVLQKFEKHVKKPVAMLTTDGEVIKIYESVTLAANDNGLHFANISACCYGKHKTCGGYKWAFI